MLPPDPTHPDAFAPFSSRRSVVHSTAGIVACTQPLAAAAGLRVLREGGNAADAAVAVAAALNMTEPTSTGIGGDMFCLFYDAATRRVRALNGSGRSPAALTPDLVREKLGITGDENDQAKIPMDSPLSVTVPGAAAGWVDTVTRFGSGRVSLEQVLAPAIKLGEEGFPVSELAAGMWAAGEPLLRHSSPTTYHHLLRPDPSTPDGFRAPRAGELFANPALARTFLALATHGKKGFYEGPMASAVASAVQSRGGVLTKNDLKMYGEEGSQEVPPVALEFDPGSLLGAAVTEGEVEEAPAPNTGTGFNYSDASSNTVHGPVRVWEHPPNGQGIVALMALGILQVLGREGKLDFSPSYSPVDPEAHIHNSPAYLHALIESLRIAFADAHWWVTDPEVTPGGTEAQTAKLLSPNYLAQRARLFNPEHAADLIEHGHPSPAHNSCDTVYLAVTDAAGNAASFINSTYGGFGSGIVPATRGGSLVGSSGDDFGSGRLGGFTLQNRGANFALGPQKHPNLVSPRKRPYHTIIPALVTWNVGNGGSRGDAGSRGDTSSGGDASFGSSGSYGPEPPDAPNAPGVIPDDGPLHSVFGVMGGFMQPQGHVQVLLNQLLFGLGPQVALDAPRFCIGAERIGSDRDRNSGQENNKPIIYLEEGIPPSTVNGLRSRGHAVKVVSGLAHRGLFGRGQVVRAREETVADQGGRHVNVFGAGSDPRGDGCAFPAD